MNILEALQVKGYVVKSSPGPEHLYYVSGSCGELYSLVYENHQWKCYPIIKRPGAAEPDEIVTMARNCHITPPPTDLWTGLKPWLVMRYNTQRLTWEKIAAHPLRGDAEQQAALMNRMVRIPTRFPLFKVVFDGGNS